MTYKPEKSQPLTAFGDLRTAELTPIVQQSFEYTVSNTELNTNTVVNGGTVTQASAMAVLSTSTTTASEALFQSKRHAKYKSGLGGLLRFTTLFETSVADSGQYIGLADERGSSEAFENGYMIGYDGVTFGLYVFQGDTVTSTAQASWDDPLDGSGPSGMTIDLTKINVWEIKFQYLGGGAITLDVENPATGLFVKAHTIQYANANITPSTYNPNFHVTMFVDNLATTTDLVLKSASYGYFVEGKTHYYELHEPSQTSGEIEETEVTAEVAIFTIRNKSTYASKTNFIDIVLESLSASIEATTANNLGGIRLVRNADLAGTPVWADINATNSVVEIDVESTTPTNGVSILPVALAGKNDKIVSNLTSYGIVLSPGETLTLAGHSAASATIDASLLWKELF